MADQEDHKILKKIGVLGGMGPEATVLFMQKIIQSISAQDDSDHIPLIIDNNPQIPSRIKAIIDGDGKDPTNTLVAMAQSLQKFGAQALAMPCNTAHYYSKSIAKSVDIPFINMVDLASEHALSKVGENGSVGLLGSPALRIAGVYDKALKEKQLSPIYYDDETTLRTLIERIKKQEPDEAIAKELSKITEKLINQGADIVMICCSEFSLLSEKITPQSHIFDSLDALIHACHAYATDCEIR